MRGRERLKSLAAYIQMRSENTLASPTASHNIHTLDTAKTQLLASVSSLVAETAQFSIG
jgi:hypothetical protein